MVASFAKAALGADDVDALKATDIDGKTVEAILTDKIATIGENMSLRRMARLSGGAVATYVHNAAAPGMGKIGVLVGLAIGGGVSGYFQVNGLDMSQLTGDEMDVSGFAVNTRVHAKLTWEMLSALGGSIFGATILISLFAMRRIKRIDLATVLR